MNISHNVFYHFFSRATKLCVLFWQKTIYLAKYHRNTPHETNINSLKLLGLFHHYSNLTFRHSLWIHVFIIGRFIDIFFGYFVMQVDDDKLMQHTLLIYQISEFIYTHETSINWFILLGQIHYYSNLTYFPYILILLCEFC